MRLTEGRIRLLRIGGAVMDGGREMLQDAFRLYLEMRMKGDWDDGQLFRKWCMENHETGQIPSQADDSCWNFITLVLMKI